MHERCHDTGETSTAALPILRRSDTQKGESREEVRRVSPRAGRSFAGGRGGRGTGEADGPQESPITLLYSK
jgi:hypothetical protein